VNATQTKQTASAPFLARPNLLLRIEGLVMLAAASAAYFLLGYRWWLFPLLLFVPDLAMIGYAINERTGAAVYNVTHLTILPLAMGAAALLLGWDQLLPLALIWLAHIGLDRTVGYGLKYPTAFQDTHLGQL
jgi:hypothetical protein